METQELTIAKHLLTPSSISEEISITGKWIPKHKGGIFWKSKDSKEMLKEWEDIHLSAKNHPGILSTEINHAVGQDAILVHHVFKNADALLDYFNTTAKAHVIALNNVAKPAEHFVRVLNISNEVKQALQDKVETVTFGKYSYGYVKENYAKPDASSAIQVTAKWKCKPDHEDKLAELNHWWQQVGKEAYTLEEGLLRFEVFEVEGESALIIHETFADTETLQFHLSKGTANMFKKNLDAIAEPTSYFFRGPVSWTIRTYSKFLGLPATYSSLGSNFTSEGGSYSDGLTNILNNNSNMENQVTVVYNWTAKEGQSEALKAIYKEVTNQMKSNEPGALNVQCYFDEAQSKLVVMDVFQDAGAVGFHLGTTAGAHFQNLLEIAIPGEFLFMGNVPQEMQEAAKGMGLKATFAPKAFGFEKVAV